MQSGKHGEFEVLKNPAVQLEEGDRVIVTAGGGGGYGDPLERDPEKVRMDVINGYVSIDHAKTDYGVIMTPGTLEINKRATKKLRNECKEKHYY